MRCAPAHTAQPFCFAVLRASPGHRLCPYGRGTTYVRGYMLFIRSLRDLDLLSDVDQIGILDAVVLRELLIGGAILGGDAGERVAFF